MSTLEAIAVLEGFRREFSIYALSEDTKKMDAALKMGIAALQKEQDKLDSAEDGDYIPLE